MNRYKLWATLVVVALVLGVIGYVVSSRRSSSVTDGLDLEQATARLELIRRALAATESLDVETVEVDWTRLHSQTPDDASIALNRALNRVLLVDELTSRATNSLLDASEKQAARQQLPRAIEDARVAVNDYETAGSDPITALWLRSRVGLHEASLLPATMTRSLRKEIFDSLVVAIEGDLGKHPKSIVLAGPIVQVLDELEDPINGLPADVEQRLRVRTSAQIYWDAAELVVQNQPAPYRTTELPLVSADLSYRGFSKRLKVNEQSPETYDYAERSTAPKWPPLQGLFTRYGDCLDLLTRWDDSMVVMGSGDPLPFRDMLSYPPSQRQAEQLEQTNRKNALHRFRTQQFRTFWTR